MDSVEGNDAKIRAERLSFLDEADVIDRCMSGQPDSLKVTDPALCAQAEKWLVNPEPCEIDPVTLDEIPSDYVIRFRQIMSDSETRLACRDVRALKEWLERSNIEGKEFLDPATRNVLGKEAVDAINRHPFSQNFNSEELRDHVYAQDAADDYEFFVNIHNINRYPITDFWNYLFISLLPYVIEFYVILWATNTGGKKFCHWFLVIMFMIYAVGYLFLKIKYHR